MSRLIPVVAFALILVSCSSVTPVAIRSGDVCFNCRRPIIETKLAGEIIDMQGHAFKFRTVGCMSEYLTANPGDLKAVFVTDFPTGKLIRAELANFVRAEIDPNTKAMDYVAFATVRQAVEYGQKAGASPIDWLAVMRMAKAS